MSVSNKSEALTWLVLVWRLPTGESSANRVSVWRALRNLGAVGLTPGAAVLPFSEDSVEQFDWLAQEVEDQGGDAWVLPVGHLSGLEERRLRDRMRADRQVEYEDLRKEATDFLKSQRQTGLTASQNRSVRQRELVALQRRFQKIRARDFFNAPGRRQAAASIGRCLATKVHLPTRTHPKE
jgi:ChrB-like protein